MRFKFQRPGRFRQLADKFIILLVISLLFTMYTSRPASSLIMIEYKLGNVAYGIETRPRDITLGYADTAPRSGFRWIAFTEQFPGRIGIIDRSGSAGQGLNVITELLLPQYLGENPEPWGLAFGSGSLPPLYFTDTRLNMIGRIAFGAGPTYTLTRFQIPTSDSHPRGIFVQNTTGIWFTEYQTGKIGCLDPNTPSIVEWQLPNPNSQPNDIIVVGNTVYFTELGADRIGAYNMSGLGPQGQYFKEYLLPSGTAPWSLTADDDGMIWFTSSGRNVIGMLNPHTGEVTEHRSIPTTNSQPHGISFDNVTGNVWFTEYQGHRITKYDPSENLFYEYPTLTAGSAPNDVVVQRYNSGTPSSGDLNNQTIAGVADVWFTEYVGNRVGLLSQGGPIATFGTTSTATITTVTSAVSAVYSAGSSSTTTTRKVQPTTTLIGNLVGTIRVTAATTNATSQTSSETAYRLSTSTFGTSTSFIVEVAYTSVTSTSTSTTYVSTTSVTSSTTMTSISTSYIATTSVTSTSTSWVTIATGTVSRTTTSTISIPSTRTTTVTETKYKTTTFGGTTSTTSTSTASVTATSTSLTILPTTVTQTTTTSLTTTPFNITGRPTCLIASAAYGSDLSPQVQALRMFRDRLVLSTFAGTQFMKVFNAWYYSFSPTIARLISNSPSLSLAARALIYPLIGILNIASSAYAVFSFNSELGVTIAGLVASSLIGLVYHTPWITALLIAVKKRRGLSLRIIYLTPFAGAWILSLVLIGIAEILLAPILMMIATAAFVLLSLGLSAVGAATLIARRLT